MEFNIRQKKLINATDKNILCLACAAAGKTRTLVGRIEKLLNDGVNPSRIVAFTFTN
jgi:superfamily I DNA/RNA helicase